MATVVDNRVVSMEFDNAKFEQNVAESLGTLKKLSNSLDTLGEGSASGLQKLTDMIGNISFDKMADGIESIADKFTLLGQIGQRVIGGIADSVVGMVSKLKSGIDSVTVDQIAEGWGKYAEKTTAVQTIMNATGKSIEEVSAQLDKLMWFTDETSYNFSDMSNSIGKFTSNGQDLEKSVIAMEGIANWTAISGQGAAQASIAMYNLSQALSAGSVKAMDWKSIELANMATKEFRETVLETAADMGTLKKKSEGVYETIAESGKKTEEVTVTSFRNALEKGFFTSDVLMAVLQKYGSFTQELNAAYEKTGLSATDLLKATDDLKNGTKTADEIFEEFEEDLAGTGVTASELGEILTKLGSDEYELGRKAFAAGQEAKTFTDAINAVKDAASSAWLRVFENIFGNYEEAKKLWTTMANDLYDIFVQDIDTLNDAIEGAGSSAWDTLTDEIDKAGVSVNDFEIAVSEMAEKNGYDMDSLISKYGTLSAALKSTEFGGWLNNNKNIITKALDSLGLSDTVVKKTGMNKDQIIANAEEIKSVIIRDWYGKFGTGDEREQAIRALGYDPEVIAKLAKEWEESNPGDAHARKVFSVDELIAAMETLDETTESTVRTWEEFDELIENADFSKVNFRQAIAQGITSSLEFIINDMNIFREAWRNTFYAGMDNNEILEKRSNSLRKFAASFASVAGHLAELSSEGSDTAAFFTNVAQGILMFGKIAYDVFSGLLTFVNPLLKLFGYIAAPILAALAALGASYNTLQQLLGDLNPIREILGSISEILGVVIDLAWKFAGGVFTKLFGNDINIGEKFSKSLEKIAKWLENVTQKFVNLKERVAEAKSLREALGIIGEAFTNLGKKIIPTEEELRAFFTKENLTKKLEDLKTNAVKGIRSFGKAVIAEWTGLDKDGLKVNLMWNEVEAFFKDPFKSIKTAIENFDLKKAQKNAKIAIRDYGRTLVAAFLGVEKDSEEAVHGWFKISNAIKHPIKTLGDAIKSIDAKKMFESITTGLSNGWKTVKQWFGLVDWGKLWDGFATFMGDSVKSIGGLFQTLWDKIVELYHSGVEYVKEKTGTNTWGEFFGWLAEQIGAKIDEFAGWISEKLKNAFVTILVAFGKSEEDAKALADSIWGFFGGIRDTIKNKLEGFNLFGTIGDTVSSIGDSASGIFSGVTSWVSGIPESGALGKFTGFFSNLWTSIKNIDFSGILDKLKSVSNILKSTIIFVIDIGLKIARLISILRTSWAIGTLAFSVRNIARAIAFQKISSALSELAKGILLIAASFILIIGAIWVLDRMIRDPDVDVDRAATGLVGIAAGLVLMVAGLQLVCGLATAVSNDHYKATFEGVGTAMLGIAGSILIMILAVKMISAMHFGLSDVPNVLKIIFVMATIVAALSVLSYFAGKNEIKFGTGLALIEMAIAIQIMASALKKVCSVDFNFNGVLLLGMIVVLGKLINWLGDEGQFKKALKGEVVLLGLAVNLLLIGSVLKKVSGLEGIWNTIGAMAVSLLILGAAANIMGDKWTTFLKGSVAILALSVALVAMGHALKSVSGLEGIWNTIGAMAASLFVLGVAANIMGNEWTEYLKGSVAILALSVALVAMGHALKTVADLGNVQDTLIQVGEALLLLGVAAFVIGTAWTPMLIGAGVIVALAVALGVMGAVLGYVSDGMIKLGGACEPFCEGLKALCEIDFLTLVEGLGKLVTIFIALGAATLTMTLGSGAKLTGMVTALVELSKNMETISGALNKLSNLGIADGTGTNNAKVNIVENAMKNLKTIFNALRDTTISAWITDFLDGGNNDLLQRAADSLVTFSGKAKGIEKTLELFGTGAASDTGAAMTNMKSLFGGLHDVENAAKNSDFSKLVSLGTNLSDFSKSVDDIKTVVNKLAEYGTEENKSAINNAISILETIVGKKGGWGVDDSGLVSVLKDAEGIDFTILNDMSSGFASFSGIKPAIDVFNELTDFNAEVTLKPLIDVFGKNGIMSDILGQTYDYGNLTTISTALASFAETFSKIPDISATVLTDLLGKSEEFIKAGQKLLEAFLEGLTPKVNESEVGTNTTEFVTVILEEIKKRNSEWTEAGEMAAAAYMSGLTTNMSSFTDTITSATQSLSSAAYMPTDVEIADSGSSGGGLAGMLSGMLSGLSGSFSMGDLFSGSITDALGLGDLTGAIDITSMFKDLGTDGFNFSSILNTKGLDGSIDIKSMFSGLGNGETFDLSSMIDLNSITGKLDVESLFKTDGLTDGTYDLSSIIDISSLEGSLDIQSLMGMPEGTDKIDLSKYVSTDGLSESISTALSESITGISTNDQGISTAVETLMNTGVKAVTDSGDSWKRSGAKVMGDAITGIKNCNGLLKKSCDKLMTDALTAITDTKEKWKAAGTTLVEALKKAISDQGPVISGAAFNVAMSGVTGARNTYNSWYQAGVYLDDGLRRGIIDNRYGVSDAAAMVASNAIAKAKQVLNERSPSRVFMQIGRYVSEGFAIGIKDEQGQVMSASEALANSAISTATTAQALIANILETDATPVIRPVLDLSEIQSQASYVSSMFGTSSLNVGSISARVSNLSSAIEMAKAQNQNGLNQPLTASLDAQSMQAILASGNKPIEVNTNIGFEGSLSQLATILYPYIKNEVNRIGPSYVNSNR